MIRQFCYVTNSCNLLTFFNGFLKLYAILVINPYRRKPIFVAMKFLVM